MIFIVKENFCKLILEKFVIQTWAVVGNEIPRTETIKTNNDNGAKGGMKDTAGDRGHDRDRYDANKWSAETKNGRQS